MMASLTTTNTQTFDDGTTVTTNTYSDSRIETAVVPGIGTAAANAQTLEQRVRQALATNATYLGLASPSTAQNTAQVKALTRQVNALIRLLAVSDTSTITDS